MTLYLNSSSPQRRAILAQARIPFVVRAVEVDELAEGDPVEVALENARRKAVAHVDVAGGRAGHMDVGAEHVGVAGDLALGVDTLVALEGRIFGKPADAAEARSMLADLDGRTHTVVSGLALRSGTDLQTAVESTAVTFRAVGPRLLDWYVATGEWRGRAGGYAIQGAGAVLVARIDGDYLNVVGLPLARLLDLRPDLLAA